MTSIKNPIITLFAAVLLLLLISAGQSAFAAIPNWEADIPDWDIKAKDLPGDTVVLDVLPAYASFEIKNMSPGDIKKSTITITNNSVYAFYLKVEVKCLEEMGMDSAGKIMDPNILAKQVIIRTYVDDVLVPGFPNNSVLAVGSVLPLSIGTYTFPYSFAPSASHKMRIEIELPGASTGNEFQDKYAKFEWIFTADFPPPPEPSDPEPPDPPPTEPPDPPYTGRPNPPGGTTIVTPPTPGGNIPEPPEILEPEVPGSPYMPKTGEAPLWYSLLPGLALIFAGLALLLKKKEAAAQ